jgi:hypothetical protein
MSDDKQIIAEIERVCATLQSIAERFSPDSAEATAIRDAALAFTVVHQHEVMLKAYKKLRLAFDGELTEEMKADLRRHGIDPDDLDFDTGSP